MHVILYVVLLCIVTGRPNMMNVSLLACAFPILSILRFAEKRDGQLKAKESTTILKRRVPGFARSYSQSCGAEVFPDFSRELASILITSYSSYILYNIWMCLFLIPIIYIYTYIDMYIYIYISNTIYINTQILLKMISINI